MRYFDTFISSTKEPKDIWKESLQEFVDKSFENASTYYEVEEEKFFGSLKFKKLKVRVTSLVDAKTGQRINDDYKKITFSDLNYRPEIGTRYKFDNNIWITFSTDNIKTDTSAVYVRRCNNTINSQDKYGNIHQEPCYIDYKITENQIFRNYSIDVPSGRIWVQCQLNEHTKDLNVNDRFIFSGDAYRIRERNKFDRRYTFEKDSSHFISFYADYDNIASDDNLELSVANYKTYNYFIKVPNSIQNIIGFSDKILYDVYLNQDIVKEEVIWKSTNPTVATIDNDGKFELISSGECYFKVEMKNKPEIKASIFVKVEEIIEDIYEDILSPMTDYIRLNGTEFYSIYEYKNYAITDTKFEVQCFDVPTKHYRFSSDGNNFYIKNIKPCEDILLKVAYTNQRTLQTRYLLVELGGIE